jgi:hypothetical protein
VVDERVPDGLDRGRRVDGRVDVAGGEDGDAHFRGRIS